MLAAQIDREQTAADLLQEAAPAQEAVHEDVAAGELAPAAEPPALAEAEVAAAEPTASEQAYGTPSVDPATLDAGMFKPEEYHAACLAAGKPDRWNDKYERGHTQAQGWTQPYEGRYAMSFELEPGYSASQAVKDFVKGPTIGNYRVIGVALEMEILRDNLGDQRFDEMFGSNDAGKDSKIPAAQRLRINEAMFTTPFADLMVALATENAAADKRASEPEEPAQEMAVEEQRAEAGVTGGTPELIADELGITREREIA